MLCAATPAMAQDVAPQRIQGKCEPSTSLEGRQFQLLGYPSSRHMGCDAVEADWKKGRLTFFERGKPVLTLSGTPETEGLSFTITHVDWIDDDDQRGPGQGKCGMFRGPGPAGPRNIVCVITRQPGFEDLYTGINFIADEPVTRPGETARFSGACQPSEAMDIVLQMELGRHFQKEQPARRSPPLLCDTAVIVGGQSVTFSMRGSPGSEVAFSGKAAEGEEQEGRIWVTHVRFGAAPVRPVLGGTCVGLRDFDGQLVTACGAAFEEGGEVKVISAEFHPAAAK